MPNSADTWNIYSFSFLLLIALNPQHEDSINLYCDHLREFAVKQRERRISCTDSRYVDDYPAQFIWHLRDLGEAQRGTVSHRRLEAGIPMGFSEI